jgi:transcriptional regulator with XRE-family HTH domain
VLLAVLATSGEDPQTAYVEQQNTHKQLRMQALGAEIARVRRQAGMQQQEHLAQASGVGVRTISIIETGTKLPRVTTMRKLENALNLPTGATDAFMAGALERLEPKPTSSVEGPLNIIPRDEVEREMVKLRKDLHPNVIWAHIVDRRERLGNEAIEKDSRMGQSG